MHTLLPRWIRSCSIAALVLAGTAVPQAAGTGAAPRMRAIVYHDFGSPDVLRLEEIDKPVPHDDQVLVKVRAASVNPFDWHFMEGTPYLARLFAFGMLSPSMTRLGVDYAGTIEAVGKDVKDFKPGDEVYGTQFGACSEYLCAQAGGSMARKPASLTFEQVASLPVAGLTALQGLRDKGKLQPGEKVLINGASGGVGTFAVQIAKSLGGDVTGVCSTRNLELVRSLGADHVIDYTKEDFTKSGVLYDLIIDNVGNRSLLECRRVLKPNGRFVLIGGGGVEDGRWIGPLIKPLKAIVLSKLVSQQMGMFMADTNTKDLDALSELIQAGKVTPVIDKRYKLSEVPDAMRYLELGHARGKVIITVDDDAAASPASPSPAAGGGSKLGPFLIVFTLIGVLIGVPIVPIIAAFVLNRGFQRRNPGKRPYRWGYYFGILSVICGIALGVLLESGTGVLLVCSLLYLLLAWFFVRRHHWAWIALTILSLNPLAWIINYVYLRKRWAEDSVPATA